MSDLRTRVRERLAGLDLDPATEAEVVDELAQHLEDRYRDLIAARTPPGEAEARAWQELEGHPRLAREIAGTRKFVITTPIQEHDSRRLSGWWDDVWFAWRRLRHAPGFALVALLTVTLTVGANTAILSVADAVLFRPLPYADPDNIAIFQMMNRKSGQQFTLTPYSLLQAVSDGCPDVSEVALLEGFSGTGRATIQTADGELPVPLMSATSNYFTVLGATAARGRLFGEADSNGVNRIAVLSHDAWVRFFGMDPAVVGRSVPLGAVTLDVVGVLPRGFVFPSVFAGRAPVVVVRAPLSGDQKGGTFHAIARISPGVSRERAQAQVDAAAAPVATRLGRPDSMPHLNDVRALLYPVGRPIMRLLLAATLFIFILGCANLATTMIVRGRRRLDETAVRLALGASRGRIVRPLVFEALILGVAGAAIAIGLTWLSFDVLFRLVPPAAHGYGRAAVGLDLRVGLIALVMGVSCAIAFSAGPAWRASGVDVMGLIRRRGGRNTRITIGRPLVAIQVAVAIALAFGAAIAARAFVDVLGRPLGFSTDSVAMLSIGPPQGVKDRQAFYTQVLTVLKADPRVEAAGGVSTLPFSRSAPYSGTKTGNVGIVHALPGYLEAARIPLKQGRTLTWEDTTAGFAPAVVSENAARAMFGTTNAVGASFESTESKVYQVVGVVADVVNRLDLESRPQAYVIPGADLRALYVIARLRDRRPGGMEELKEPLRAVAPGVVEVRPWAELVDDDISFASPRFQTLVLGSLAVLALALTALGVFSVVAYAVTGRMREMGVRLAVGASPASLVGLIVRQSLWPVAAGLVLGSLLIWWGSQLVEAQLFKVEAADPRMAVAAALTVAIASVLAAYLPARRASKISPTEVLRAE